MVSPEFTPTSQILGSRGTLKQWCEGSETASGVAVAEVDTPTFANSVRGCENPRDLGSTKRRERTGGFGEEKGMIGAIAISMFVSLTIALPGLL